MTLSEIKDLHAKILTQLGNGLFKDAFSSLGYLIQQNGFGAPFDTLSQHETTYRYLLQYSLDGYHDAGRGKVLEQLRRKLAALADRALFDWRMGFSREWYFSEARLRKQRLGAAGTVSPNPLEVLAIADRLETLIPLRAPMSEAQENDFFLEVLFSESWKPADREALGRLFEGLDPVARATCTSAVYLSALMLFDQEKILLLTELARNEDQEVSARALCLLFLLLEVYRERLAYYPTLSAAVGLLLEDPEQKALARTVCLQLIRAKDTEALQRVVQEEILPEVNKMGQQLHDKLEKDHKLPDLETMEDWLGDGQALSKKMIEFNQLQSKGEDVYLSSFAHLKSYPFFKDISHWFLPFDPNHSGIASVFTGQEPGINLAKVIYQSEHLCSSDKYSMCLNLAQMPEDLRKRMVVHLGAESESMAEMVQMEQNGSERLKKSACAVRFIHDLYRFYRFFNGKEGFGEVFSLPLNLWENPLLSEALSSEESLREVAGVYVEKNCFEPAARLYARLVESFPSDASLHQHLGLCYRQLERYDEAVDEFTRADLIQGDNAWTLKQLAACLRKCGRREEAMDGYIRLAKLEPDNLSVCLNQGHCLVDMKRYKEALNAYFKAEFLFAESEKTWRPIAWCSLMCGQHEQAEKYYRKLLAGQARFDDYVNAGHLAWITGSAGLAADRYLSGARNTKSDLKTLLDRIEADKPMLLKMGIDADFFPLMRDGLHYRWEEEAGQ